MKLGPEGTLGESLLSDPATQLSAIIDNTTMALFVMNDRQQCVFANHAAERLTGYSVEELRAGPLHDIIHHRHPDGRPYPLEDCPIDRALPERSQMQGEETFVHKDGHMYPVAFTASPIRDGQGQGIGTIIEVRPIADEKAQHETLETLNRTGQALAAELDLKRLVQMVTDAGVGLTGARFGAFFYNDFAEDGEKYYLYTLSGAHRSEFDDFGMPRATAVFHPTFVGEGVIRSPDILADPRYGLSAPHYGMPKGHLPVRSYLAVPVQSRSGEVIGGLFFGHPEPDRFQDRHEQLMVGIAAQAAVAIDNARLYGELRNLNETLEQRVQDAVAERERIEEALRQAQKMEAVGQLTGGIAHDFNNLLTVVTGNIDMSLRSLDNAGVDNARARRALGNALKGAERAAALTQRLLAFSRQQPLAPRPTDVDKLVLGISDMLTRSIGEMIKLEVITSPGLWRVEVDPNQLESALLNLAVNARDAMTSGGKLIIEMANARLDEEYCASRADIAPGQYVVIVVTDTGTGMSRDTAARVFEPFFTTKEVGKGTGLGLSMVYGFVKQSGGHVNIYSEPGQGTTVKIYLPRLVSEVSEEVRARDPIEGTAQAETILVVEDDDDVRAYTVECLNELGYHVLEAHDAEAALRLIERRSEAPDLLFTDVVMPGMSGRELAEAARKLRPDLKVLYTSGYTRNAIVHGGRLDSGVEMIVKPFTYAALGQKVRDMLDAGQTGRVLIVEPDATVRMLASDGLVSAGYAAEEAANAAEALNKVRAAQGRYDFLLIERNLPDRTGEALLAELRAMHADLPILITVADGAAELAGRLSHDRCTAVLTKPYSTATLREALRTAGANCADNKG